MIVVFRKSRNPKITNCRSIFYQNLFDLVFKQIEFNMRELGHGDVSVNKNMKYLVKIFYNVLLYCEDYNVKNRQSKSTFFAKYLISNIKTKTPNNEPLIKYFNAFHSFCFDLSSDSVLQGELNFNYK